MWYAVIKGLWEQLRFTALFITRNRTQMNATERAALSQLQAAYTALAKAAAKCADLGCITAAAHGKVLDAAVICENDANEYILSQSESLSLQHGNN
jgi:hypothetical protein